MTLTLPYSFLYYSKFTKPNFPDEMKTEEEIRATLRPRLLSHIDTYLQAKIEAGAEAAPHATAVGPPASPSTPAAPGPSNSTTTATATDKQPQPSRDFGDPESASASVTVPVVTRRGREVKPPRKLSEATESQDGRTESHGQAGTSGGSSMPRLRRAGGTTSPPVAPYAG